VHHGDEDDDGGGAHQGRDQPLFQVIEEFHGFRGGKNGAAAPPRRQAYLAASLLMAEIRSLPMRPSILLHRQQGLAPFGLLFHAEGVDLVLPVFLIASSAMSLSRWAIALA
jgi:hypothetical protein